MRALYSDLCYSIRMLWKSPAFSAIAVSALAIGIGINTALFSLVNQVLLSPLPFRDAGRIISVYSSNHQNKVKFGGCSGPDFLDWQKRNHSFLELATMQKDCQLYMTGAGEPCVLRGALVTSGFFRVLGLGTWLGRPFTRDEAEMGRHQVIIFSYKLWQRCFGGDTNVIGKTLSVEGKPFTLVGVLPPLVGFLDTVAEAFIPFPSQRLQTERGSRYFAVFGRLNPGITVKQAQAEMASHARVLAQEFPSTNKGWEVTLMRLHDDLVKSLRPAFLVLHAAVGLLWLIACINVANLLLARSHARGNEQAIRAALGANWTALVRPLLLESLLLAVMGGAMGLLLAAWLSPMLLAFLPTAANLSLPMGISPNLDRFVMGFTLLLSMITGLVCGLAPALQAAQPNLVGALKESGRSAAMSPRRQRALNGLVVAETALSLTLLVGAGLFIRSYFMLQQTNPGFNGHNILTVELELPHYQYRGNIKPDSFYRQVIQGITALPGVEMAAGIHLLPLGPERFNAAFKINGSSSSTADQWKRAEHRVIHPDYFRTMKVPLKKGRTFGPQDHSQAPLVTVINETLAQQLFSQNNPLGQRLQLSETEQFEIIGVVGDEKAGGLGAENPPTMYACYLQQCWGQMSLVIRTRSDPLSLVPMVRKEIRAIAPNQPIGQIQTMQQRLNRSIAIPRFIMILFAFFAMVALMLAAVGIYGMMAYVVNQRTREMGVRIAIGATVKDIYLLVAGQGLKMVGLGLVIGTGTSWTAGRAVQRLLYKTSGSDPLIFIVASLFLLGAAGIACFLPARRATQVDPIVTLRNE